ncbi:MAG: hypothetical protein AAFW46_01000 [Pseudomonadota bacterium]
MTTHLAALPAAAPRIWGEAPERRSPERQAPEKPARYAKSMSPCASFGRLRSAVSPPRLDGRMRDPDLDRALLSELDVAPDER